LRSASRLAGGGARGGGMGGGAGGGGCYSEDCTYSVGTRSCRNSLLMPTDVIVVSHADKADLSFAENVSHL